MMMAKMTCEGIVGKAGFVSMTQEQKDMRAKVLAKAEEDVAAMTEADKEALRTKMKDKSAILSKLPMPEQVRYMKGLSESDMLDFAKAQLLFREQIGMKQQVGQPVEPAPAPKAVDMKKKEEPAPGGEGESKPPAKLHTPLQQEM